MDERETKFTKLMQLKYAHLFTTYLILSLLPDSMTTLTAVTTSRESRHVF